MTDELWLDYETKSACNLLVHGSYNYARDATTKPLCMGYAFNDEEPALWWPAEPFPDRIRQHFKNGGRIYAHNAGFDRLITEYVVCPDYDVPTPPLTAWYCTATQAGANCAPRKLEDVGRFAGSRHRKNHRGTALIRLLCIPRADGTFNEDPDLMHEMGVYCLDDIRTMREVSKAMRPLTEDELSHYHVNERINDRGVLVDRAMADAAQRYSVEELEEVQALVNEITHGAVPTIRSPKMREWVIERVGSDILKMMEVWEDGEMRYSLDKTVRANILLSEDYEQCPPDVMDVIQCADDIWASSVAKYKRMSQLADFDDDRVRGAFVTNGGAATGRSSSYGLQVHNFTRKVSKTPQEVRDAMVANKSIVPQYGKRVTDVLKSMLRPTLVAAPGKTLVVADWSKIEAVLNPWLSNSPLAEPVLDIFRSGRDLYAREAAGIYRVDENVILEGVEAEDERYTAMRQNGKVAVLACGFGGSVGAFAAMGRNYGVVMSESDARKIVYAWRRANPWAPEYWDKLEDAYTRAMRNPGTEFAAGRVTYLYDSQHLWYALPSGRILCYPYARLEADGVTYAKSAWKPRADATEWPRARLWKGLACENCWSGNTRLVTDSGVKRIQDILDSDLIWDGYEFVPHGGVVCNGVQEVLQWADVYVTKHHQIFDGKTWSAVIALTESTIDRSLKWGQYLASENIALNGKAITRSFTTSPKVKPAMKLPRITNERREVYDVKNCGSRHQYMVVTDLGFLIAHNCTQATANDLLRDALRKCEEENLPVVLHCHDEIVAEVDLKVAEQERQLLEDIMLETPSWGPDIPLAVELKVMPRYGK